MKQWRSIPLFFYFEVQVEYTGDMKLLFPFTKSFIKFAKDTGIVADSKDDALNALEDQFNIKLVETNSYDPDDAGFIMSTYKAEIRYVCNWGCNNFVSARWRKAMYVGGQVEDLWQALAVLDIVFAHVGVTHGNAVPVNSNSTWT
jgi:hypothetical protein